MFRPTPPPAGPKMFSHLLDHSYERPQSVLKKRGTHSSGRVTPDGFAERSPAKKRVRLAAMDTIPISDIADREALKAFLYERVSISNAPSPLAPSPKRPVIVTTPSPARRRVQLGYATPTSSRPSPLFGQPTPPRTPVSPRSSRTPRRLSRRRSLNPEGLPGTRKVDEVVTPSSIKARVSSWLHKTPEVSVTRSQSLRRDIDARWVSSPQMSSPVSMQKQERTDTNLWVQKRHLIHRIFTSKELCWDVRDIPSMAKTVTTHARFVPLHPSIQAEAALCPNVLQAEIHLLDSPFWNLEQKWGPIVVQRTHSLQPIAVWHIMEAIYAYFHHPVTQGDLLALAATRMSRELLEETWRQRNFDRSRSGARSSSQIHDPTIRRVDLLGGSSKFWRIKVGSLDRASCQLFLSLR